MMNTQSPSATHKLTFGHDRAATWVTCECGWRGDVHHGNFGATRADADLHLKETRKLSEAAR